MKPILLLCIFVSSCLAAWIPSCLESCQGGNVTPQEEGEAEPLLLGVGVTREVMERQNPFIIVPATIEVGSIDEMSQPTIIETPLSATREEGSIDEMSHSTMMEAQPTRTSVVDFDQPTQIVEEGPELRYVWFTGSTMGAQPTGESTTSDEARVPSGLTIRMIINGVERDMEATADQSAQLNELRQSVGGGEPTQEQMQQMYDILLGPILRSEGVFEVNPETRIHDIEPPPTEDEGFPFPFRDGFVWILGNEMCLTQPTSDAYFDNLKVPLGVCAVFNLKNRKIGRMRRNISFSGDLSLIRFE
jgi:hypothetical protein